MTPQKLDELLQGALQQSAGTRREEWMRCACEGDVELLEELRSLVRAHLDAESSGFFGPPRSSSAPLDGSGGDSPRR